MDNDGGCSFPGQDITNDGGGHHSDTANGHVSQRTHTTWPIDRDVCSGTRARGTHVRKQYGKPANKGACSIATIAALGCIRLHACQLLRKRCFHQMGFRTRFLLRTLCFCT